jgi:succinate dehydrogenase / fumarate reductase membrane anchor subunit
MSLRLRRVPAGAHYGLRDWLGQRISSLVILSFVLCVAGSMIAAPRLDYDAWAGVFAPTSMKVFAELTMAALCYHAWIGVRDIWMDYVKPVGLRLALLSLTLLWLAYCLVWAVQILWSI